MTISISGQIDSATVELVRADTTSRKVIVVSSGGSVQSALEIRKLLMARSGSGVIREVEVRVADSAALFILMSPFSLKVDYSASFVVHLPTGFKDGHDADMPVEMIRLWDYLQSHYGWQDGSMVHAKVLEMLTVDVVLHRLVDAC